MDEPSTIQQPSETTTIGTKRPRCDAGSDLLEELLLLALQDDIQQEVSLPETNTTTAPQTTETPTQPRQEENNTSEFIYKSPT